MGVVDGLDGDGGRRSTVLVRKVVGRTADNVLRFKGAAAGQPVLGCPDHDPTHGCLGVSPRKHSITPNLPWIGCVWELPPILHERDAWVRHILAPQVPDLTAYLADSLFEGTTGDPGAAPA